MGYNRGYGAKSTPSIKNNNQNFNKNIPTSRTKLKKGRTSFQIKKDSSKSFKQVEG